MSEPQERKTLLVARAAVWENTRKERFLVGKRPGTSSNYPNRYEIPGGKREDGEPAVDTALREVREETNLLVTRIPLITFFHHYLMTEPGSEGSRFYGYEISTYVIEAIAQNPQALFATPPEHTSLEWMTIDEAETQNLMPQSSFVLPYLRMRQRESQPKVYAVPDWKPPMDLPLLAAVNLR